MCILEKEAKHGDGNHVAKINLAWIIHVPIPLINFLMLRGSHFNRFEGIHIYYVIHCMRTISVVIYLMKKRPSLTMN